MKKISVVLVLVSVLLMISQSFSTNGTYLNGFSAISIGRGGLSYGFYDSPILIMRDPAAISFMPTSLEGNFSLLIPKLHFKNALNDKEGETKYFPMGDLVFVNRYQDSNWNWGFGVFTQGGMGSDFKLKNALFRDQNGNYILQDYHSKFGVIEAGPSISFKGGENISIGASVHLLYGQMEMKMPYSLSPSVMMGVAMPGLTFGQLFGSPMSQGGLGYTEVTAYADMRDVTGFGVNGTVSAQYKVSDRVTVGAGFTSNSSLKLRDGTATMDMTAQFNDAFNRLVVAALMQMGITNPANATPEQLQMAQQGVLQQFGQLGINPAQGFKTTYDADADLKLPAVMGIGFSYNATDMLTLGADVQYVLWKTAFNNMKLKFTNGTNANINRMLGGTSFDTEFPLEWENTYIVKVGAQMKFSPLLIGRVGFIHGKNPVPDQTVFPVFPAIVENHVTAGFTLNFTSRIAFNAAYELALNKSQTSTNSIIASEYNNSTSELMEHLLNASVLIRF